MLILVRQLDLTAANNWTASLLTHLRKYAETTTMEIQAQRDSLLLTLLEQVGTDANGMVTIKTVRLGVTAVLATERIHQTIPGGYRKPA